MAASDMVEALYKKRTGYLHKLSAKQFIDCQKLGCDSGDTGDSLNNFNVSEYKVFRDSEYPFSDDGQQECQVDPKGGIAIVQQATKINASFDAIKLKLQEGPIAGAVYATDPYFHHHHGPGIIEECSNDNGVNLYVTFIGYGKDMLQRDFLIGKNNWGRGWGDYGYFKIFPNTCGILNEDYLYQFS